MKTDLKIFIKFVLKTCKVRAIPGRPYSSVFWNKTKQTLPIPTKHYCLLYSKYVKKVQQDSKNLKITKIIPGKKPLKRRSMS